jgi:ribose transport system permease protein
MMSTAANDSVSGGRNAARWLVHTLGPLLALIVIVLFFAVSVRIHAVGEQRDYLFEQAAGLQRAGQTPDPIPSYWRMLWEHEENYLTARNFRIVGNQTVAVGIAAMGMTLIIISGGIDLSVGSVIALASVMTAWCLRADLPVVVSAGAGIALGGLCGLANGAMIVGLRIVPFIATLGMLGIARGLAKGIGDEQTINPPPNWLSGAALRTRPEPAWLLISPGMWTMLVVTVVALAALRYTRFGRYVFAIGSNEATARLCGLRVRRIKLFIYVIGGLCAGLAGVMQFSRLTVGDPTTAVGTELDVIAAVVIGGGSLIGGEGSAFGSLIGALIMAFLRSGCDALGVSNWIQEILIGAVIVVAVALDQWRHRRTA